MMKLYISKKVKEKDNQIIIGTKKSDYSSLLSGFPELDLIRERLAKDKRITVINRPGRTIIVISLKEEDKGADLLQENARRDAHSIYAILKDMGISNLVIQNAGVEPERIVAFTEGLVLSDYQFIKYFTEKDKHSYTIQQIGILSKGITGDMLEKLSSVLMGVEFSRDLVNEPLSYLTAEKLSEEISKAGEVAGFTVEVFNKKKIEALRMGGLLAVNKGSIDPPTFSILEWKPENAVNKKPYVLVGKGVVYDTGGLSLKPTGDSMDYMKSDMGGAAAVAGTFVSVAKSKIPVWIIGLIPATDNRPDGNAYTPGDVVVMHNGTTVEVLNTDAEGRMILADALSYAKQYDPSLVIELSTLTGASHYAIGTYGIVGMGNAPREEMDALITSGNHTNERIAEFPFWDDYAELLKSDIADLKNIGGRIGGSITAGKFLEKFTDYPYIHLDIAGPAYNKTEYNYRGKGGSGVGVRLLFDYFDHLTR